MKALSIKNSVISKPKQTIKYPPHREQGMRLKDEEQLAFKALPQAKSVSYFDTAHRYKKNGAPEKVLGAVYTPPRVAAALTRWAVRSGSDTVLDPSCGEGVFVSGANTAF